MNENRKVVIMKEFRNNYFERSYGFRGTLCICMCGIFITQNLLILLTLRKCHCPVTSLSMVFHMGDHYIGPNGLGGFEDLRPAGYKRRCTVHGPPYRQVFITSTHYRYYF